MKILLVGGRGFLGSALQDFLRSHDVFTLDRDEGSENHFQADILDEELLAQYFSGMDAVVNLVGLSPLFTPRVSYEEIHVRGLASVVQAAQQARVPYLVHISALGVDIDAATEYLRSKARGEVVVRTFDGESLIVRPSVLFDTDSELIGLLEKCSWLRMFPRINAQLQPVYRLDVARWLSEAIVSGRTGTYELAGLHIVTLTDFAELIYALKGRGMVRLPSWTARLSAGLLAKLPSTRISADQVRSLDLDNVLSPDSDAHKVVLETSLFDWLSRRD